MLTDIHLPAETLHTRNVVDRCEWKLRRFVEFDAYVPYDYWITTLGVRDARVYRQHLYAINNAMRARAAVAPWERFFDQPIPELDELPSELDLITSPGDEVDRGLAALSAFTRRIASRPKVTDMAVSKILHLVRPRFVPISDSYVRLCLGVRDSEPDGRIPRGELFARRLERVARAMRSLGLANAESVERLFAFANGLSPVVPKNGPFRGQTVPIRLSRVRILDILLWSDVAIHGKPPHPEWAPAYASEFGDQTRVEAATEALRRPHGDRQDLKPDASDAATDVSGTGHVAVFIDRDSEYVEWLARHSNGLVLNCERSPRASYLILHRASCGTISGTPARGKNWTGPYIKVCASERATLESWAQLKTGGKLRGCRMCRP